MQPLEVFYKKVFLEISHIHRKTSVPESMTRECFPVNFVKFLRTPFLQNTSRRLLSKSTKLTIVQDFVFAPVEEFTRRFSVKKNVRRNFDKFAEKHLCWSLSFNKVAGLQPATLLKNRLSTKNIKETFSCEFGKIFKKRTIFIEHLRLLLCKIKFLIGDLSEGDRGDLILHGVLS